MKLTGTERSLVDAFQALKRIELQFTKQSNILQMYLWRYLYYYMRIFCNLIGLEQWYFSLI